MATAQTNVRTKSSVVNAMEELWQYIRPLMEGTLACRKAGELLMPRFPVESIGSWRARLNRAVLIPAYARTMRVMVGKPFSKQITPGDDVPEEVKKWCDDIDLEGNNLHSFMCEVALEAAAFGLCGVLTEYPSVADGEVVNQAQKKERGLRPYLVHIHHNQLLGWKWRRAYGAEKRLGGPIVLTQLRFLETVEVDLDDGYNTKTVEQIRVIEEDRWYVQRFNNGVWSNVPANQGGEGKNTLGRVPFRPYYGRRTGFMTGEPLCVDLIFQNILHFQSSSDQQNILHVARVPILAATGVDPDKFKLEVSTAQAVKLPKDGDLKFVEHTGASIEAGRVSIQDLEGQMILTGAELLIEQPGQAKTATQANNDADGNKSDLQRFTEQLEDNIDATMQDMVDFEAEPGMKEAGHFTLFKDFNAANLTDASAQLIISLRNARGITRETMLIEMKRRGVLSAEVNPEEELEAVDNEPPELGVLVPGKPGQPPVPPGPAPAPAPKPKPAKPPAGAE